MVGDFNLIVNPEDKSNSRLHRGLMSSFRRLLSDLELKEIYLAGRRFTWSNEREAPTLERIDRVFASSDWDDLHPNVFLSALSTATSDHCPLLLDLAADLRIGRRFHFECFWLKAPGFLQAVEEAWHVDAQWIVNPFQRLAARLRRTAKKLKSWSARFIGNIKMQFLVASEVILRLEMAMDSRPLSPQERGLRALLKRKLLGLASLERTIARQRSRLLWLKEGDTNTHFFHASARHRRRKNFITSLESVGGVVSDHEGMSAEADAFFGGLLGSCANRELALDFDFLGVEQHAPIGLE